MAPRREGQVGLGQAIRTLREGAGLTQEELAHAADLHPTWVSHLESGRANPAWGTVRRISAALGMPVSTLAAEAERLEPDS